MSQKYSITSNSANKNRRKSVFTPNINTTSETSSQTIELERLEQEITLTLQSIDKSFSKSHKIINDKLLPIVKRYHTNSKNIWSGVNFWKTFLEASANVELRGYEEAVQHQSELNSQEENEEGNELLNADDVLRSDAGDEQLRENEELSPVKVPTSMGGEDILMESTDYTQTKKGKELKENPIMPLISQRNVGFDTSDSILPSLPPISVNVTNTNETDVNQTTPTLQRIESRHYVIHNNLDTTYNIEVSPRKSRKRPSVVSSMTPKKANKKRKSFYQQKFDSSPFELEPPQLKSDVLFSPVKRASPLRKSYTEDRKSLPNDGNETQRFPLTPRYGAGGNLLRTPGQVAQTAKRYSGHNFQPDTSKDIDTYHTGFEDSEETPNISPPVTIHFATAESAHKLNRTPTREVAQNIVNDILDNVSGINDSVDLNKNANDVTRDEIDDKKESKAVFDDDFDAFLDKPAQTSKENEDWSE